MTTFISIKTLYDQIWNIFVDQIYIFFDFFRIYKFLATPGGRTMHPWRLIMKINNVINDIYENFYSDQEDV